MRSWGGRLRLAFNRVLIAVILAAGVVGIAVAGPAVCWANESNGERACTPSLEAKHNPLEVGPTTGRICFDAFVSTFESAPPLDGRALGVPLWVGYEVDRGQPPKTRRPRPSRWYTVPSLVRQGLAPTNDSYTTTEAFRRANSNWFERGHLAPKFLAERVSEDAARYTHNVVNAVPERSNLNKGPWFQLECETGAWANEFGAVWVIAGPVFIDGHPSSWLNADGAMPVAIPDALFKIVARKDDRDGGYQILSFLYPQESPTTKETRWDERIWRVTLQRIEALTGLSLVGPGIKISDAPIDDLWQLRYQDFDRGCLRFAPPVSAATDVQAVTR
jgi:endonuclease G